MKLQIHKLQGRRNDLLLVLEKAEIATAFLHIANREALMRLPGLVRHGPDQDLGDREMVGVCKVPVAEHLRQMSQEGYLSQDSDGIPQVPLIVVGCRNTGNNHGFVAWQRDRLPHFFHVRGDPLNYPSYSCPGCGSRG